jgi:hypothetical protein
MIRIIEVDCNGKTKHVGVNKLSIIYVSVVFGVDCMS